MPVSFEVLDHRAPRMAARIHAVQSAAYRREADLLGVDHFPPLDRTAEDIAASTDLYFGAVGDGALLGVISLERRGAQEAVISSLTVEPSVQRRGLGRALVAVAAIHARYDRLWVSTGAKNLPALALYRKLGFEEQRRRRAGAEDIEVVELVALTSNISSEFANFPQR